MHFYIFAKGENIAKNRKMSESLVKLGFTNIFVFVKMEKMYFRAKTHQMIIYTGKNNKSLFDLRSLLLANFLLGDFSEKVTYRIGIEKHKIF